MVEQDEYAQSGADDALLNQRRIGRQVVGLLVEAPQIDFGMGIMRARAQPAVVGGDLRPNGFDHSRILDPIDERLQSSDAVDEVRAGNRDAAPRGALEEAPLVRHHVERLEGRSGDRAVASECVPIQGYPVRRDIRDRHDDIHLLPRDELKQKLPKCFWLQLRRRVGDMADAVLGGRRQADRVLRAYQGRHAASPQRAHDGERRSLVAVGHKRLHVARPDPGTRSRPARPGNPLSGASSNHGSKTRCATSGAWRARAFRRVASSTAAVRRAS